MGRLRKEFVLESINHYKEIIDDYVEIILENEQLIANPTTSKKKKEAARVLINVCQSEIEKCRKNIKELLNG